MSFNHRMLTLSRQVITLACGEIFEPSRFSSNSEANASELLENLEEMFPRY